MNVALIGFGYWGKIIYRTLKKLNCKVTIVESNNIDFSFIESEDILNVCSDYKKIDSDYIIVATPLSSHFEICKFFIEKQKNVFCEKPLCLSEEECNILYNLSDQNQVNLFVDWIFLFNPAVNKIKDVIEKKKLGELYSISMRRLNKGPIRKDINARFDLMSHDISILLHLLNSNPTSLKFFDYSKNFMSLKNDSCMSIIKFGEHIVCSIECSWEHPVKDRKCYFEFEKGILVWDDTQQSITIDNEVYYFHEETSPLMESIKNFLYNKNYDYGYSKKITLDTTKILNI